MTAKTSAEIELMKRQIEAQLDEYEQAISEYRSWLDDWRKRQRPTDDALRARYGTRTEEP